MMKKSSFDVVVIGSGPAGLSAALAAAEQGASVVIFERLNTFGAKILASGGGKCNVSNVLDKEAFAAAFGREGRFMHSALDAGYHEWLFPFLKSRGVPLKCDDGFHYFPRSEKARDILDAFANAFRELGGVMVNNTLVSGLVIEEKRICGVKLQDGTLVKCKSVILCGGGRAWHNLGCRHGLDLALEAGHTVSPLYPAMAPLLVREKWVHELTGISLPDSEILFRSGKKLLRNRGELLFTHGGLSGPCAIDLAGGLAEAVDKHGDIAITLRFDSAKDVNYWENWLCRMCREEGKKQIQTIVASVFPKALANALCSIAQCGEVKGCELPGSSRQALAGVLGGAQLTAYGSGPMEKAMAMKGGVKLKEINPATFESRIVKGLYFAGEIVDLTGPCGGYNIQFAIASGRLAGNSSR